MEGTVVNAGMGLASSSLARAILEAGITTQGLRNIDQMILWEMLEQLGLRPEQRFSLIGAARSQVDVIFLQGSASYLVTELGLQGKLMPKMKMMDLVEEKINTSSAQPVELLHFANLLLARTLFNSSATPGIYVFAQRQCRSLDDIIYTQLWAGYTDSVGEKWLDENKRKDSLKMVVIDLGIHPANRYLLVLAHMYSTCV